MFPYRCVATSVAGFIQQLAVSYVGRGYVFYVCGEIPGHKAPEKTDQKILRQYDVGLSKWARARRKRAGLANVHYLRHGRFYVILATHGDHPFFDGEGERVRDVRRRPLKFAGHSISFRMGQGKWHPSVRIELERYREVKAYFEEVASKKSVETLTRELHALPFQPFAPVRGQLFNVLRALNRKRAAGGLEPVAVTALRLRRAPVKVFT